MNNFSLGIPLTPMIKKLMIVNVAIWFFIQLIGEGLFKIPITEYFALIPYKTIFNFWVWQFFSYMFMHSHSVMHILFNMLMLWFMGSELEQRWGSKYFLSFYLFSGIGAAIIYCAGVLIYALFTKSTIAMQIPVVGASGAIYGLMMAYGYIFGDRIIYFFMVFPMKARYFVLIMGAIQLANLMTSTIAGEDVAYLAHLGGIISGYIFLKTQSLWRNLFSGSKKDSSKRGKLRLVVDNDKNSNQGPKYWN